MPDGYFSVRGLGVFQRVIFLQSDFAKQDKQIFLAKTRSAYNDIRRTVYKARAD